MIWIRNKEFPVSKVDLCCRDLIRLGMFRQELCRQHTVSVVVDCRYIAQDRFGYCGFLAFGFCGSCWIFCLGYANKMYTSIGQN